MMKKRKDSGFTLIELMIVIAVIGILAIVLVPRVGTVKEQAKNAGLETNLQSVQGYVESRITKWNDNGYDDDEIAEDIKNAFEGSATDKRIVNPHSTSYNVAVEDSVGGTADSFSFTDALQIYGDGDDPNGQGAIGVLINDPLTDGIEITSYDLNNNVYSTVTVRP